MENSQTNSTRIYAGSFITRNMTHLIVYFQPLFTSRSSFFEYIRREENKVQSNMETPSKNTMSNTAKQAYKKAVVGSFSKVKSPKEKKVGFIHPTSILSPKKPSYKDLEVENTRLKETVARLLAKEESLQNEIVDLSLKEKVQSEAISTLFQREACLLHQINIRDAGYQSLWDAHQALGDLCGQKVRKNHPQHSRFF